MSVLALAASSRASAPVVATVNAAVSVLAMAASSRASAPVAATRRTPVKASVPHTDLSLGAKGPQVMRQLAPVLVSGRGSAKASAQESPGSQ